MLPPPSGFRLDESDPRFLVVHEGHMAPADYQRLFQHWTKRLDDHERAASKPRFGILVIHEPHDHDEDEEPERDTEGEAEMVRLFNDFRRDQRARVSAACTGFANVYAAHDVVRWYGDEAEGLATMQPDTARFAQYNFGIPGGVFTDEDEARLWLLEQAAHRPHGAANGAGRRASDGEPLPGSVGLFYGSTTGVTEWVAERLADSWQAAGQAPLVPINITGMGDVGQLLAYDRLILGIPTWNVGQLQDDWERALPALDRLDFAGRQVALFGVGDARGYPKNFLDAVGLLGHRLRARGARLVGFWPRDGYDFDESEALEAGRLMGLGIDEVNQPDQTDARLAQWVQQLIAEFALEPALA